MVEQTTSRTLTGWLAEAARDKIGGRRAQNMPRGLGPRDWGNLGRRPITNLFFQLVQEVLLSLGIVDLARDVCLGEGFLCVLTLKNN